MKKFIIAIIVVFALAAQAFVLMANDREANDIWNRANNAYIGGEYREAIETYDSLIQKEYVSYKLYYNLGNSYYKDGQIGKAILNYNRALLLNPGNEDIRHNLLVANTQVVDKIQVLPEFFLVTFFKNIRNSASSNTWAVVSLAALVLVLAGILLYLLSSSFGLRKSGFYGAVIMFAVLIFALFFAVANRQEQLHSPEAIIMIGSAAVKSSPDSNSKDIFILHEGTKVSIVDSIGDWFEITIADGNKGWIMKNYIEKIQ